MFSAMNTRTGFVRNLGAWMLCGVVVLFVAACRTPPKPGLTEAQITALRGVGFHEEEGKGWEFNLDGRLLFNTNDSTLTDQNREIIARIVDVLKTIGISQLKVEGYADSTGSVRHNEELSLRRAEAVAREIDANGLPYSNIAVQGFGTANPVANNATREGRAQNRRVAIIVPVEE
jgi:outer membrane protein OmpA-like peptidoglycan-associated protein